MELRLRKNIICKYRFATCYFGVELFLKSFNLRLGYNFRRAEELDSGTAQFLWCSLGFGLKFNKLKFNYSYSRYTLAGNTSLFGLTINFQ
jgi:hypothetical protein